MVKEKFSCSIICPHERVEGGMIVMVARSDYPDGPEVVGGDELWSGL